MRYGIRITVQRKDDDMTRSLWHWEDKNSPCLFDSKKDAEAYIEQKSIPIYCREWEIQTMSIQEYDE